LGPAPGNPEINATQGELAQVRSRMNNPWGTPENHPGKLGKLAHAFSVLGNVAGDIVAPNVMARIPQTELGGREREDVLAKRLDTETQHAAENKRTEAQTGLFGVETKKGEAELPYVGPEKEAEMEQKQAMAKLYQSAGQGNADRQKALETLSNPNASEADRRHAEAVIANDPLGMTPMGRSLETGAGRLFGQGEIAARVGGGEIMPDPNSPTGYSKILRDHMGNIIGSQPTEPTSPNLLAMGPQQGPFIHGQAELAGARAGATQAQGLIPIIDPKTNDVIGYAPRGAVAGATGAGTKGMHAAMAGGLTPKPTGATETHAQSGAALEHMITDNIYPAIDAAAASGDVGIFTGRVQEFLARRVGNPDSAAAELKAQLQAVPRMLQGMYGMKNAQEAENEENKFYGLKMEPGALKAFLEGNRKHAATLAQQGGMGRENTAPPTQNNAPPPGAKITKFADIK
jgi:hypothetical protein